MAAAGRAKRFAAMAMRQIRGRDLDAELSGALSVWSGGVVEGRRQAELEELRRRKLDAKQKQSEGPASMLGCVMQKGE